MACRVHNQNHTAFRESTNCELAPPGHQLAMSRNNGKGPKMELKLNVSPPARRSRGGPSRAAAAHEDCDRSSSSSPTSLPSSCVSSESDQGPSNSPEATSMVLVGCPRCLMYVMLSEKEPKCPKCKSTVLLDFNTATKG